jgi:hypothetical protein
VAVKLLMSWNIVPGREQEYFEFVVRDFIPGLQRMELTVSDAWFTVYGNEPQIVAAAEMPTLASLEGVMESPEWQGLIKQLLDYVEDYQYKIVQARAGFQL